ncbi:hypothetical protein M758_UG067800 [Ceratodon purpureus]|nr:hypothetical protein M758_UG067800 [Ceratodon purpureus]
MVSDIPNLSVIDSCGRTMSPPSFGGLRNYNAENDCKCGPNCACADCQCHK